MWFIATLASFFIARKIAIKFKHPLCNPLLLSLLILAPCLLYSGDTYQEYLAQNKPIHFMLGPVIIALAYPLYTQLHLIRKQWKIILIACVFSSVSSIILGTLLTLAAGGDWIIAASVLPKSISTPFALTTSAQIGGIPELTAALVLLAGLFGALMGYPILNRLNIHSPLARGLSIGAISHAIGTAKAVENGYLEGAISSLALVICGTVSALLAPFLFHLIQWVIM